MIGHLLKAYRKDSNFTLRAFADRLKVSPATLCRIESGKPMEQQVFLRLINWIFEPHVPPKSKEPAAQTSNKDYAAARRIFKEYCDSEVNKLNGTGFAEWCESRLHSDKAPNDA